MNGFKNLLVVGWIIVLAGGVFAQGRNSEVGLVITEEAYLKTDVRMSNLDVLSGGPAAVQAADLLGSVIANDLILSGLCRIGYDDDTLTAGGDTLEFYFTIEGTVEGPLRDATQTGRDEPVTVSLNLLTWPERQLLMNKRYRPLPEQLRTTAHHFATRPCTG